MNCNSVEVLRYRMFLFHGPPGLVDQLKAVSYRSMIRNVGIKLVLVSR